MAGSSGAAEADDDGAPGRAPRQILPRWDLVPLSRITHSDVSSWVHELSDEGLAPATVRRPPRPVWPSQRPSAMDGSSGTSPRAYPSPALWPRPSVSSLANDTLIRVLAYAGLRWGELMALTACRIDLARRRIEVVEAITEVHGRVVVGTTKTHQRRSVPIPRFLADQLADHLAGKAPADLVFTAPEGGVLRNTNFRPRFFDPAAEKVGLLD